MGILYFENFKNSLVNLTNFQVFSLSFKHSVFGLRFLKKVLVFILEVPWLHQSLSLQCIHL